MRYFVLYFFGACLLFFSSPSDAAEPFLGCPEWCRKVYGSAGVRAYDNCLVQTQQEGYCGKAAIKIPIPTPRPNYNPGSQSNSGGSGLVCEDGFAEALRICETAIERTQMGCDYKNNQEMNSISTQLANLSIALSSKRSASIRDSCAKMMSATQSIGSALQSFKTQCNDSISYCRTSCDEVVKFARENPDCFVGTGGGLTGLTRDQASGRGTSSLQRCDAQSVKIAEANGALQENANNRVTAASCEEATNGGDAGNTALVEYCQQNPTTPGCAGQANLDCNNPEIAANNQTCICSRDPYSPACRGVQTQVASASAGEGMGDFSSRMNNGNTGEGDIDFSLGSGFNLTHAPLDKSGSSGGEAVDGDQGGGTVSASSSVSAKNFKKALVAERSEGETPAVTGSFYGASKGIGNNLPSGAGHGSRGYNNSEETTKPPSPGTASSSPDLRKFLPGGINDPRRRGLAGISGPDGITGPHSDIWKKIQNRYRLVSPTLIEP